MHKMGDIGEFKIEGDNYLLNGEKFNIYSGAIHYFRTVPEYWEDRLLKLKACGLNTVETYVPWNAHEEVQGEFNFDWILDIENFLDIAQKLGIYAIVRPAPYICSEWEFGGLPAWLLKDPHMEIRCMYQPYLDAVEKWFTELIPRLAKKQITKGGNIIAMQIENEYGSFSNDHEYLKWNEDLMKSLGVDVLLFTSDGPQDSMLSGGTLPHIHKTANFGSMPGMSFNKLRQYEKTGPLTCMEFWLGWFDHYGTIHHRRPAKETLLHLKPIVDGGNNFNLYMFHGGTNFGHWAGANYYSKYAPTTTSYDYNAPLNEYGDYTKKYHAIRKLMQTRYSEPLPELPPSPKLQSVGTVTLTEKTSLFSNLENLSTSFSTIRPKPMEYYDQNYGFIMYEHTIDGKYPNANIELQNLADRAYVYVNDELKGIAHRAKTENVRVGTLTTGDVVKVFVDTMGRVNYGPKMMDRKGVTQIRIGMQLLSHFKTTCIPIPKVENIDFSKPVTNGPVFYRGTFNAKTDADTFLHIAGLEKGYAFVNGFNIGRFWSVGPSKSLYIPAPILKDVNELVILDLEDKNTTSVQILDKHRLK